MPFDTSNIYIKDIVVNINSPHSSNVILNELVIDTFIDIYIRYIETFKFIKFQWSELDSYITTHPNHRIDLYFLRYINTIKNISEENEINSICYDTYYNTYSDIENQHITPNIKTIFSHTQCIQLFKFIISTYKLNPHWNWLEIQDYLTTMWVYAKNKHNKYNNLLPLKIHFNTYSFKNEQIIPIIPLYIDIKTIEELRIIVISNIDWDNVNKLEFELYNENCLINISFIRLNKFNTIIHGIFTVYFKPIYKSKTLQINEFINKPINIVNISQINNNFKILEKYVKILTVYTTHSYKDKNLLFNNMEFEIISTSTSHITNFSLNIIEMYLNFFKDTYKIDPWKIHKK